MVVISQQSTAMIPIDNEKKIMRVVRYLWHKGQEFKQKGNNILEEAKTVSQALIRDGDGK